MTNTQAAKQWLAANAEYKDAERRRDEAAKVLKAHFAKSKTTVFRGVQYACSSYEQLDTAKAKEMLGDKAPMVPRTRETLSPVPVPA